MDPPPGRGLTWPAKALVDHLGQVHSQERSDVVDPHSDALAHAERLGKGVPRCRAPSAADGHSGHSVLMWGWDSYNRTRLKVRESEMLKVHTVYMHKLRNFSICHRDLVVYASSQQALKLDG